MLLRGCKRLNAIVHAQLTICHASAVQVGGESGVSLPCMPVTGCMVTEPLTPTSRIWMHPDNLLDRWDSKEAPRDVLTVPVRPKAVGRESSRVSMTARLSFKLAIRSSGSGTNGSTISGTACSGLGLSYSSPAATASGSCASAGGKAAEPTRPRANVQQICLAPQEEAVFVQQAPLPAQNKRLPGDRCEKVRRAGRAAHQHLGLRQGRLEVVEVQGGVEGEEAHHGALIGCLHAPWGVRPRSGGPGVSLPCLWCSRPFLMSCSVQQAVWLLTLG